MPELSQLGSSGLPQINFQPINPSSYINASWVPEPLPPDLRDAYGKQGQAAVLGVAAKTIADLPDTFTKSYKSGVDLGKSQRDLQQQNQGIALKNEILSGNLSDDRKAALQGLTIGPDGSTTVKAPGLYDLPMARAKLEAEQAHASVYGAQAEKYRWQAQNGGRVLNPVAQAYAGGDDGGVIGVGTSYGYKGDQFGGPDATASRIGADGSVLDEHSIGLSPDTERRAIAAGYKLGDWVPLQTETGEIVTRKWSDKSAQWDPTGKWSVDDHGRYIPKTGGTPSANLPESERLPALHGRFDFHATSSGHPSPYNGVKIVGIVPKDGSTAHPSAYTEPPLPTGSAANPPVPQAVAAPAPGGAPATADFSGLKFAPGASPGASILPNFTPDPITAGAPPAQPDAPAAAPADSSPVRPDGTVDLDKMKGIPGGGVKITDNGQFHGTVYRHGTGADTYFTEETPDAIHVIPLYQKPGAPAIQTKKKDASMTGMTYPSVAAAEADLGAGAAKNAKVNPDGSVTIAKVMNDDSTVKAMADGVADGSIPPDQIDRKVKPQVLAELQKRGVNTSQIMMDYLADKRHIQALNGNQQLAIRQATALANEQLDVVEQLNEEYKRSNYPSVNKVLAGIAKSGFQGTPEQTAAQLLQGQTNELTAELSKVFMGGASPTTHAMELAGELLKPEFSHDTFKASINQVRKNLNIRMHTLNSIGTAGKSTGDQGLPGNSPTPSAPSAVPSAMVRMRAPDGSEQFVKPEVVEKYKSKGAVVVQ